MPAAVVTTTTHAAIRFLASGGEGQGATLATEALKGMAAGKSTAIVLVMLSVLAASAIGYQLQAGSERPEGAANQRADEPKAESRVPRTDLHGDPLPDGALLRLGTI